MMREYLLNNAINITNNREDATILFEYYNACHFVEHYTLEARNSYSVAMEALEENDMIEYEGSRDDFLHYKKMFVEYVNNAMDIYDHNANLISALRRNNTMLYLYDYDDLFDMYKEVTSWVLAH